MRPSSLLGLAASCAATASAAAIYRRDDAHSGCTSKSFNDFAWSVDAISYNTSIVFTTPAHQIDHGFVQFNVTNPALGTDAAFCSAFSTQLQDFFYGNIIYNCTAPPSANTSETTFTFDAPTSSITLNQTWTCSDEDPTSPTTFYYSGAANLTLQCSDYSYTNPNWTMGSTFSENKTTCFGQDITIVPFLEQAAA